MSFIILNFISIDCEAGKNSEADKYLMSKFEDMDYQDKIKIRSFILRKDQICELFRFNKAEQLNFEKLWGDDIYLVIQLKNVGKLASWGQLLYIINNRNSRKLEIRSLHSNMKSFVNYLIPVTGILPSKGQDIPKIKVKWSKLFAY